MKKFILSIFVISLIIGVYSCKKDNIHRLSDQQQENEAVNRSKQVIALIKDFKHKMDSDLKSGGSISLDSAIWNMEAALNYDYATPDSASMNFITRKSVYTLTIDANQFSTFTDVDNVYELMEDTLLLQFNALSNSVKIIILSDVSLDSIDGTVAHISVTNGFGLDLPSAYDPFDEDDDWYWGTITGPLAGKCYDTTMIGVSDGSNELQKRLNNPLLVPAEQIFGYTDVEIRETEGSYYDNRLYFDFTGNIDSCLSNERLTYYLWQSDEIIHSYIGQGGERPAGKDFIRVEILDYIVVPTGTVWYLHYYKIHYGIPYYVPPPY